MSITVRGSSFQATVHHQSARHRKSFATKGEAEAWMLRTKAALLRGEPLETGDNPNPDRPTTLKALFDMTFNRYWRGGKSERTMRLTGNLLLTGLGENLSPAAVTEQRIDNYVLSMEKEGLSGATVNRRLSILSKMLTFAQERGFIVRKPKIDRRDEGEHRIRYITAEEEVKLIAYFHHIGQPDMADFCMVAIDTGLRFGELMRVEARDIQGGVLTVWITKSGKPRGIPLTERSAEVLARRAGSITVGKLWEGWTHPRMRHYWDQARRHMGLMTDQQFVIHTMRHTFCSRLVMAGVDIVTVSQLAGHSSITVTMRYVHLAPHSLTDAIRKLEKHAVDSKPPIQPQPQACGVSVADTVLNT